MKRNQERSAKFEARIAKLLSRRLPLYIAVIGVCIISMAVMIAGAVYLTPETKTESLAGAVYADDNTEPGEEQQNPETQATEALLQQMETLPTEQTEKKIIQVSAKNDWSEKRITVDLIIDGNSLQLKTTAKTVGAFLKKHGFKVGEKDYVSVADDVTLYDGLCICIIHAQTEIIEYDISIAFETEIIEDETLYEDEEYVENEGASGVRHIVKSQTMMNGVMVESEILETSVVKEPVNRVIRKGTAVRTTATTTVATTVATTRATTVATTKATTKATTTEATTKATTTETTTEATTAPAEPPKATEEDQETITVDGVVYNIEKSFQGRAVAYYSNYENPLTYSGRRAVPGHSIAVDKSVIPLGSLVYVTSLDGTSWTYGVASADDIGGGIKGNIIDLFMGSYSECVAHGNRQCMIYIITPAD